ncbi:hypothetical protein ZWY2020_017791 [Hordeum vulgare]|nr:hypothetical protein ZWY2020_017791 [Hordeum vulgare]
MRDAAALDLEPHAGPPRTALAAAADHCARLLRLCGAAANPGAGRAVHARAVMVGLLASAALCTTLLSYPAAAGGGGGLREARRLFDEVPAARRNVFTWNSLLSAYAKSGRLADARAVFAEMPERDAVSWTVMVVGLNRARRFWEAVEAFLDMVGDGLAPTQFTLTNVLSSCAAVEAGGAWRRVHLRRQARPGRLRACGQLGAQHVRQVRGRRDGEGRV